MGVKTQKEKPQKKKKTNVTTTASELYSDLLRIYFDQYNDLSDAERSKVEPKYDPVNLILDEYDYKQCFEESEDLPPLEGDEEKKFYIVIHTIIKRC